MFDMLLTKLYNSCYNILCYEKRKFIMLEEIERYAFLEKVPIMMKDGIEYLCNFIKFEREFT